MTNSSHKWRKTQRVWREIVMNVCHFSCRNNNSIFKNQTIFSIDKLKIRSKLLFFVCNHQYNSQLIKYIYSLFTICDLSLKLTQKVIRGVKLYSNKRMSQVYKSNSAYLFDYICKQQVDSPSSKISQSKHRPFFVTKDTQLKLGLNSQIFYYLTYLKCIFFNIILI